MSKKTTEEGDTIVEGRPELTRKTAQEVLEDDNLEGFFLIARDNEGKYSILFRTGPGIHPFEYLEEGSRCLIELLRKKGDHNG